MYKKIINQQNITIKEAKDLIDSISEGALSQTQMAAILTALTIKGVTIDEITGFAIRLREKASKINVSEYKNIVDNCGTGGDCANTFNISTTSAILAASSGLHVAKHSNFGFTSNCGSSNVLQALNIHLSQSAKEAEKALKNNNIAFLHAPYFHKSTANIASVRKELGFRTVFNLLGPLTNPTAPTGQVIGVADKNLCPTIIKVLKNLGCKKALVVNGENPTLDEITICGKTTIYRLENNKIDNFEVHPTDFGIKQALIKDLQGGTAEFNANIIKGLFSGEIKDAKLDAVAINTAALLWVGNKANSIEEGLKLAYELVNSGIAIKKLDQITS